jgi:hypothetical protein
MNSSAENVMRLFVVLQANVKTNLKLKYLLILL